MEMKNAIEFFMLNMYVGMGIDQPSNHDIIVEFIEDDVKETADPKKWNDDDIRIAFRRFIELYQEDLTK